MSKIPTPDEAVAWAAALAGCPERYHHCTLNRWRGAIPPKVKEWATSDGSKIPWCLTLLGLPGRGKTHLATAAFSLLAGERIVDLGPARIDLGISSATLTLTNERGPLWLAARHLPELVLTKQESVRSLAEHGLMLLDDLGRGDSQLGRELAVSLLLDRYDAGRKTIVTVNAEDIREVDALDPALTSRLCEGDIVRLRGADHRMKR